MKLELTAEWVEHVHDYDGGQPPAFDAVLFLNGIEVGRSKEHYVPLSGNRLASEVAQLLIEKNS